MPKAQPGFIRVRVRSYIVMHGYDAESKEIEEVVTKDEFQEKLIAVERIQSVSEKYILTTFAAGRLIYWEYEGGLGQIAIRLEKAGLLVPNP